MKPTKITFNELELHAVLINSVRYCLTRRSYAVQECCDLLQDKWNNISTSTQNIIEKDIRKHIKDDDTAIDIRNKELSEGAVEDRVGCYPILPEDHREAWEGVLKQIDINQEVEYCRRMDEAAMKLIKDSQDKKVYLSKLIGKLCITIQDGQIVYDLIYSLLGKSKEVDLDFTDVKIVAAPFVNYAIGRLYRDISAQKIKSLLSFSNITKVNSKVLTLCLDNAERYWTDPNYKYSVDRAIEEQFVE